MSTSHLAQDLACPSRSFAVGGWAGLENCRQVLGTGGTAHGPGVPPRAREVYFDGDTQRVLTAACCCTTTSSPSKACYCTHPHLATFYFLTKARRAWSTQLHLAQLCVLTIGGPPCPHELRLPSGAAPGRGHLLRGHVGLRPPSPVGVPHPLGN